MRKLSILVFTALMTVTLAAPSFAAETTITGSYRIRGVSDWNYAKSDTVIGGAFGNIVSAHDRLYTGYFDQRFRMTITHKRSEFLKAVVSVDIAEDIWGQQRNFKTNYSNGVTDGYINTAYIEAITKVGLFKLGIDNIGGRFGHGTWSDSGMNAGSGGNPGITWGMKIDNFVATVSYVKYIDLIDTVFGNLAGGVPFQVWPGGFPVTNANLIGGSGSDYRGSDLNTYILTAHYIAT